MEMDPAVRPALQGACTCGPGTWKPGPRRPQPTASWAPFADQAKVKTKLKDLVCLKISDHTILSEESEEDYCLKAYVFGFILSLTMDVQLFWFWVVLWVFWSSS